MKRMIAACLILTLCLSLCACGKRISEEEAIAIADSLLGCTGTITVIPEGISTIIR